MNNLIRNLLIPSAVTAAAAALLVAVGADIARAEEISASEAAVSAAASMPVDAVPSNVARQPAGSDASAASSRKKTGVERRCERTERIGKFHITRCD